MADILLTIFESRGAAALSSTLSNLSGGFLDLETRAGRMTTLGAGLSGTALGLRAINDSAKAAGNEAAAASVQLDGMLRARGETAARANLDALAARMADLTGKDDDLFTTAEVRLLSFGLTAKQIAAIMPGIEGQSETMHQSLEGVAEGFGRAFASGNAAALKRQGVVLSEADLAAIKLAKSTSEAAGQQEIFNRVLASFEHFAVGAGGGISEAEKAQGRWNTQMGNAKELFGQGVGEAQIGIYTRLAGAIQSLNEQHPALIKGLGEISAYAQVGSTIAGPLLTGAGAWMKMRDSANLAKIAGQGLGAGAGGMGPLVSGLRAAQDASGRWRDTLSGKFIDAATAQRLNLTKAVIGDTAAEAAKIPVAAEETAAIAGTGAAAEGTALRMAGLSRAAGLAGAAAIIAAGAYAAWKAPEWMQSATTLDDEDLAKKGPVENAIGQAAGFLSGQAGSLASGFESASGSGGGGLAGGSGFLEALSNPSRVIQGYQAAEFRRQREVAQVGQPSITPTSGGGHVIQFPPVRLPPSGITRQAQRDSDDLDDETAP